MPSPPSERRDLRPDDLEFIEEPLVRRFLAYWLSRRRGRLMPSRRDIDPIDLPWALPSIYLIDYERDTDDFRYRIAGEEVAEVFGRSTLKGLTFDDILPPHRAEMIKARWRPIIETPAVAHMKGMVYQPMHRVPMGERLVAPLSEDGVTADSLIGITMCRWRVPEGPQPVELADLRLIDVREFAP